ncbi:glycosyltransferase [Thioalkalivibrio sp. ALJ24]|uniref:glycosyltransferase n=1 Tax=Thioalkalivibrio sp. ALJ24 TaxID=545276 RepID=UPI0009FE0BB4|nr:glycosyltransferase [Thioalkalivibrio sp. ALJ24]
MRVVIFFVTRFSVLLPPQERGSEWASIEMAFEEHKQQIFDDERLSTRMRTFETFTLPSISAQQIPAEPNVEIVHLVLTSTELPPDFLRKLESLADQHAHLRVVKVAPGSCGLANDAHPANIDAAIRQQVHEKCEKNEEPVLFATVRLDDDDALSTQYVKTLCGHLGPDMAGYVFSMPVGFLCELDATQRNMTDLRHWSFPKIALGLAYFNRYEPDSGGRYFDEETFHIHNCGSHVSIDTRYPVIIDSRYPGYLATVNGVNDSGDHSYMKFLPKAPATTVKEAFPGVSGITETLPGADPDGTRKPEVDIRNASQHRAVYLELAHSVRHYRWMLRAIGKMRRIAESFLRFNRKRGAS